MLSNFAEKIADKMVVAGANVDNKESIAYGIESTIMEIIANILVFSIAILMGKVLEMLIWQTFWLSLRVNIGGHHSNTHFACLSISTAIAVVSVLLVPYLEMIPWVIIIEVVFSIAIAFTIAPFMHQKRPYSEKFRLKLKKTSRIVVVIETVLVILFYFVFPTSVAHCAALGMFTASIMCVFGKVEYYFKSKTKNAS